MRKKTFIAVWHKIQRDGCKENANLCSYLKFVKKVAFFKKFGHSGCANFGKANSKVADILLFSKLCVKTLRGKWRKCVLLHPIDKKFT